MKKRYFVFCMTAILFLFGIGTLFQNDAKADVSYEDIEQFPESYQEALYKLKEKHPNWVFQMYDTGLDWDVVVYNEMTPAYRSLLPSYFDSSLIGDYYGDGWSCATKKAVEYYLDPRNWLTENYIFQFELLTYNGTYQGISTVNKVLANSFMSGYIEGYEGMGLTYAQAFYDIGRSLGVSPVHLAGRVYQEQGVNGTSELISGTYPGFEGYYNYFNIQASGATREQIVVNGLNEAKSEGWNSRYSALLGGAKKVAKNYILRGQDTLYLQKFDVDPSYDGRYWHQYMQNLAAPSNEGYKTKKAYQNAGALESSFVFKIPVYRNMPQTYSGSVDEGTYIISSAMNNNLVLGVADASTDNKANIELQAFTLEKSQQFYIKKDSEGYYRIINVNSNAALDVYKSGGENGTNVQQWSQNNNSSQQWMITDAGNGYYYFISVCNEKYLDVADGLAKSGANIQMYSGLGENRQKFKLTLAEDMLVPDIANIESGTYIISAADNSELVLGIQNSSTSNGGNLNLQTSTGAANQQFTIERDSKGYFIIKSVNSGMALDVYKSGNTNGTNIQQWKRNTNTSQQWIIKETGDGYYYIIAKCNGLYMSVADNIAKNGKNIYCYDGNGYTTQKFVLNKVIDTSGPSATLAEGTYVISPAADTNLAVEIAGASLDNKANVELGSYKGNVNQQFVIKSDGNGYYTITAVSSGKCLDVYKSGKVNGTNVQQWACNTNTSQRWKFIDAGNGCYYIASKCNGMLLNAAGSGTAIGNNIEMYAALGMNSQMFKLSKVSDSTMVAGTEIAIEEGTYTISSVMDVNKVIAIQGASFDDKGNVDLEQYNGSASQQFVIEKAENGYYFIKAVNSGKALDVYKSGTANGTNVQQWKPNSNSSQRWKFYYAGNDSYYIVSKCNGLYMHIAGDAANDGANIDMYKGSSSESMMFKLNRISSDKIYSGNDVAVESGTYIISPAYDNGLAIGVQDSSTANKANIQLESISNNDNQLFVIEKGTDGYYTISNVNSGARLDVYKSGTAEGTNVQQWAKNSNSSQYWKFKYAGSGMYYLVSKCNGMYMSGASVVAGANVQMTSVRNNATTVFKLTKISDNSIVVGDEVQIAEGTYVICSEADNGYVVGISSASTDNKANVELQESNGANNQKFKITKSSDGYYRITNINSGKNLDVYKSGTANGTNVQQWAVNSNSSQRWKFYYAGNGAYYIVSGCNGLCMDIAAGAIQTGTNIQTYEKNGSDAQKFRLIIQ